MPSSHSPSPHPIWPWDICQYTGPATVWFILSRWTAPSQAAKASEKPTWQDFTLSSFLNEPMSCWHISNPNSEVLLSADILKISLTKGNKMFFLAKIKLTYLIYNNCSDFSEYPRHATKGISFVVWREGDSRWIPEPSWLVTKQSKATWGAWRWRRQLAASDAFLVPCYSCFVAFVTTVTWLLCYSSKKDTFIWLLVWSGSAHCNSCRS